MEKIDKIENIKSVVFNPKIVRLILILLIPIWYFVIADFLVKIPNDFSYEADIISIDNFYDEQRGAFRGEQFSKTKFSYDVVRKNGNTLIIQNTFNVKSLDDKTIFKAAPLYGINALTGGHVAGAGDKDRVGYLFAPRFLKKGQSFTYWHADSSLPLDMVYEGEENLHGLKVYKYKKSNNEPMDQTSFMGFLPDVPEKRGIKLASDVLMWVEPISGYMVKVEDFSTDYFYFDMKTGERLVPYNKFSNTYNENSVIEHVGNATTLKWEIIFIKFIIPLIFFVLLVLHLNSRRLGVANKILLENKLGVLVLFAGLFITTILYFATIRNFEKEEYDLLSKQSSDITSLIERRTEIYLNTLLGGRGLFQASKSVEREEWHAYVESLDLKNNYSGMLGLGFSKVVLPSDKDSFVKSVRKEGFPNFNIEPDGKRDIYTSILYVEPFNDANKRAFGFDMFSQETRRDAMIRASNTGLPSVSGKVRLIQNDSGDESPGFLAYLPVYSGEKDSSTISGIGKNVIGFVYGPFRVDQLIQRVVSLKSADISYRIYDGLKTTPEQLIYNDSKSDSSNILFRKTSTIYVGGHPWTIEFINASTYSRHKIDILLPYLIVLIGFVLSFTVFWLLYSINRSRKEAVLYAEETNKSLIKNISELQDTKKAVLNVLDDMQADKKRLAKESSRLELATKSAKIGVWEWDLNNGSIIWDNQMCAIYGVENIQCVDSYEAWIKLLHPEDVKKFDSAIRSATEGQKDLDIIYRIILPNGETRYIKALAIVEQDVDNKAIEMIGVNWDITKETIVDREKTEFVSLASHQLKTPVGAINWNLEMLLAGDYGKITKKQKEILEESYTLNMRINELINALLNISRIEMGVFIIEPVKTNFAKLCEEVVTEMQVRILEKGHSLEKKFAENLPEVPADPKLLRIVFQNFISNAIKYTPNNGKITISLTTDKEGIIFSVANNGDPIPEADQSRIFQKMYRASNAQEQDTDGNGLGLYVVKQIIESAGGKIWFISKKGEDTVFACSLPLSGMIAKSGTKKLS